LEPALRSFLEGRCRDGNEVDDVIQETLLRAARYRSSLVDPARLRGWALRIAGNVLRDHVRRECRLPRVEAGDEWLATLSGSEPDPGGHGEDVSLSGAGVVFEKAELLDQMEVALDGLRRTDRRVLWSYYRGSPSCSRTAQELDIPAALVKVRLFRARRRLLQALLERLPFDAEPAPAAKTGGTR
jgi:RNA polymerase sigma-70 factor (ECF subfamily)